MSSFGFPVSTEICKNDEENICVVTQSSSVAPRLDASFPSFSSAEELEDATPSQAKRTKGNEQQATLQNVVKTLKNITERISSQVAEPNNSRFLTYCDEMLLKMTPKRAESIKREINYLLLDAQELQELERN